MKYFGKEGYTEIAKNLMGNTNYLYDNLIDIGYEVICKPELNIVAFNHPDMETNELADKLSQYNWNVSVSKCPVAIRIVLMNHIKKSNLKELIEDLKEIF